MHKTRLVTLSLIAVAIGATAIYVLSSRRPPEPAPAPPPGNSSTAGTVAEVREVREALLKELKTVTLKNCRLKRYGGTGAGDQADIGGYLMCENLAAGIQTAYSYGIAGEDSWGCQVSREFGVTVHQYDCFNDDRPSCDGGHFVFHDECVGPKAETIDKRPFDTIPSQVVRNGDAGKVLLMKIDVEGAEWDSFLSAQDSVFEQIDQLDVEFHHVEDPKYIDTLRRLKRFFYIAHVHYNNFSCDPALRPFPSWAFEVLLVNKRIAMTDGSPASAGPAGVDAANNPSWPDCQAPRGVPVL